MSWQTSSLDNGLQLVTEEMKEVSSVALSFWVGTGSRDETEQEAGMSHFLEHLLFKGTQTRSALDIAHAIDGAGGDMNAFTTRECTAFYVRVLEEDLDVALDVLCDIMCAPAFDPAEVDSERNVVLEEILMHGDEPSDVAQEKLSQALFPDHGLGKDVLGDEASIHKMSSQSLAQFFEHHYRPNNLVFAAAGRVDHNRLVDGVRKRWHGRSGGSRPTRQAPRVSTGGHHHVKRDTDQTHMVYGVDAPSQHDMARYPASVLDVILGGGMSSRLFQEVREVRGLAYTVQSSYAAYDDSGEMSIYLGTAPNRVEQADEVIRAEIDRLVTKGVTDEELRRAKRSLRAERLLGMEDTTARMSRLGRNQLVYGNVLSLDEVDRRIEAVTADDVASTAAAMFASEPTLVTVGKGKR